MHCSDLKGKEIQEREYMYMCGWFTLLYSRSENNVVKQLYPNLKKKKALAELFWLMAVITSHCISGSGFDGQKLRESLFPRLSGGFSGSTRNKLFIIGVETSGN